MNLGIAGGIAAAPKNYLRQGLIDRAKSRADKKEKLLERIKGKLKPDAMSLAEGCTASLKTARRILGMLSSEPMMSDDAFIELHELVMTSLVMASESITSAAAWQGAKTGSARKSAIAMHDASPKTAEKILVKDCWMLWRKTPSDYKSKAAFALAMLDKCEHLTSPKIIEDWCRKWERSEPC